MSQNERANFYRHSILIVDYTKDGLADLIEVDVVNKYSSFEDFINKHQHEIYHLCYNRGRCCQCPQGNVQTQSRILHPSQLDLLFDKHGSKLPCHNPVRQGEFCCCTAKSGLSLTVLDVTLARCILINFCSDVFWDSCLTKIGVTLEDCLNKNKHDLYHLFIRNQPCCQCFTGYKYPVYQKSINQNEWKLLFGAAHSPCTIHTIPNTGAPNVCSVSATTGISVNHLTPSLAGIILENFCSLRQAVDILIQSRNNIYGHANEAKISDSDFASYWSTTEKALLEISKTNSKERETKQKLDDLQKRCLDETLLEQYKVKILEHIQTEHNIQEYIEEKTEEIKENVKRVEEKTDKILQLITKEQEIKRRRIIQYTQSRIQVHVDEKTYVSINAEKKAMTSIQNTSMVVIVGPPGVGKSRMGLDLMRQYSELHKNYHCLLIDNIIELTDIVNIDDNCIILCDDIFGKTNCYYNEDDHSRSLEAMYTYVQSGHVKVIVTMRDNIKRMCSHIFNRHRLFQDTQFLHIGLEYTMSVDEKRECLLNHLRKNSIGVTNYSSNESAFVNTNTIDEIISLKPNSVLGFAESCFLFASNKKFLTSGADFFKSANEVLCQTISELRKRGGNNRQCMVDYIILVYVLVNGDTIDLNKINIESLSELSLTTYGDRQNTLTFDEVEDATSRLCGQMLHEIKPGTYSFQHRATFEAVLLSYRHFDQSKMIQLMDYKFILEFARPYEYQAVEGEVFVRVHKNQYKEMANKLVSQVLESNRYVRNSYRYVCTIVSSQICRSAGVDIIKEMCDNYYDFGFEIQRAYFLLHSKTFDTSIYAKSFDLSVAILLYTNDHNVVQYLLNIIDRKLSSRKCFDLKDLLSLLFILVCHTQSDYKAREVWKRIKSYQIYVTGNGFEFDSGWDLVVKDISIYQFMWSIVDDHKLLDLRAIMNTTCYYGNEKVVKLLLKRFDQSLFDVKDAMNSACKSGKIEVVTLLLETFDNSLFDVKEAMNNACSRRKVEFVQFLLETFDNSLFDVKEAMNNACKSGEVELVLLLLETFDNSLFDVTEAMNNACRWRKVEFVQFLLETFDNSLFDVKDAMNNACASGEVELVQFLVETFDNSLFNVKEAMNNACKWGIVELVQFLLETFDNSLFNIKEAINNPCNVGKVELVQFLLETFDHSLFNVKEAMNNACESGEVEYVQFLLERFDNSLFNVKEAMNNACESGEVELVQLLLETFDHSLFNVKEAMNNACNSGEVELVQFLLERFDNSLFNVKEAMNNACESGEVELVQLLLETFDHSLFDVKKGMNYGCESGGVEVVKLLLERFDHSLFDVKKGMNNACIGGKVELVKVLLETFEYTVFNVQEAMNNACKGGSVQLVKLLLEKFDNKLFDIKVALSTACQNRRVQVANILLETFDQNVLNVRTALRIAKRVGDKELVSSLQKAMASESDNKKCSCLIL